MNNKVSEHLAECIYSLFELQVRRTPEATAITSSEGSITYFELNSMIKRVSQHLRTSGVEVGTLVGICLDRKITLIVSILAILKAGGTYVPLDPNYPLERTSFIINDAQIPILLIQESMWAHLPENMLNSCIILEDLLKLEYFDEDEASLIKPKSSDLAYVIYTSGSTGTPKGVAIEHRRHGSKKAFLG
jgi:non-ribosomal peptide synthetase component F